MSFLQRIPFLQPRMRPVGDTLESGDAATLKSRRRKQALLKAGMLLTLLVVTLFVFPRGTVYKYTVPTDEIWRQPNLHAPFFFAIQKPAEQFEAEKAAARSAAFPVFYIDTEADASLRNRASELRASMDRILGHYGAYLLNSTRGRFELAAVDSLAHYQSKDSLSVRFTDQEWDVLRNSFASSQLGLVASSRSTVPEARIDVETLNLARQLTMPLIASGVVDVDRSYFTSDSLMSRNPDTNRGRKYSVSEVITLTEALQTVQAQLQNTWPSDAIRIQIAEKFFGAIIRPNLEWGEEATQEAIDLLEAEVSPSEGVVRENEVIVRQGDRVTEEINRKLQSLQAELISQQGETVPWKTVLGHLIVTLATFLVFFLYIFILRRPIFDDNRMMMLITLLFLGVVLVYGVALRAALIDMYVVPVAIVAIMLTVIFDSRVGLFGALTMALIGSHLLNYDFSFTFATFFASSLGVFSVRDIRNRSQFFLSSSLVFLGYLAVLTANLLLQNTPIDRFTDLVVFVAINSVLMLLAYPALWIFERLFGVTTDLTLLELSDMNRPLLKDLSMKAPGTFNHTLQVANLAESAASSIGANALLTRVGALYHDIGKMIKPEYFVENQRGGVNPHDGLKPRMSALIIASHVKEGIDMARRNRIPTEVEDFIPMHHGTTRIEYFYQRALSQVKEGDAPLLESEFRYPGPKPQSKETSILMLADGVEAASRALDNPTHKRLEGLIDSIIEARREDGQLDDTDLTFTDLRTIKEAFLSVLTGIYHVRVKYPGEEEGDRSKDEKAQTSGNETANALDG